MGADAIATECETKRKVVAGMLESLASLATTQVNSVGKFTIPGLCMIKTRKKPAKKAGKREVFGKTIMVKAKPAKTIVKAYCVAALKKSVGAAEPSLGSSGGQSCCRGQSAQQRL